MDFTFHARDGVPALCLPPAYRQFVAAADPAETGGAYHALPPDAAIEPISNPGELAWEGNTWRMGLSRDNRWCCEIHNVLSNRWVPVANLAPDFASGEIVQRGGRMTAPSPHFLNYPIDQAILIHRLALLGCGVLHASGLLMDGKVYLFCGRSGVGKTTLARLLRSAGALLLNDDRMIVRILGGKAVAAATPWHGEDPEMHTDMAPLGGIFHLNQAPGNRLQALDKEHAVARILATAVAPFYARAATERLLETWGEVAESVPSYQLDFTPDQRVWALIQSEALHT